MRGVEREHRDEWLGFGEVGTRECGQGEDFVGDKMQSVLLAKSETGLESRPPVAAAEGVMRIAENESLDAGRCGAVAGLQRRKELGAGEGGQRRRPDGNEGDGGASVKKHIVAGWGTCLVRACGMS